MDQSVDVPQRVPRYSRDGTVFSRVSLWRECKSKKQKNEVQFCGKDEDKFLAVKKITPTQKARAKSKGIDVKKTIKNVNQFFKAWGLTLCCCDSEDEVKFVVDSIMNSDKNGIEWKQYAITKNLKNIEFHKNYDELEFKMFIHGNHWLSVRKSHTIENLNNPWGLFAGKRFKAGLYLSCKILSLFCEQILKIRN